jgi:hypothetical protein
MELALSFDGILQYFAYKHLPKNLQAISQPFAELAGKIVQTVPSGPERTAALRKLLEAKDCAVRAALPKVNDIEDLKVWE